MKYLLPVYWPFDLKTPHPKSVSLPLRTEEKIRLPPVVHIREVSRNPEAVASVSAGKLFPLHCSQIRSIDSLRAH